jgi:hypothetical protein
MDYVVQIEMAKKQLKIKSHPLTSAIASAIFEEFGHEYDYKGGRYYSIEHDTVLIDGVFVVNSLTFNGIDIDHSLVNKVMMLNSIGGRYNKGMLGMDPKKPGRSSSDLRTKREANRVISVSTDDNAATYASKMMAFVAAIKEDDMAGRICDRAFAGVDYPTDDLREYLSTQIQANVRYYAKYLMYSKHKKVWHGAKQQRKFREYVLTKINFDFPFNS